MRPWLLGSNQIAQKCDEILWKVVQFVLGYSFQGYCAKIQDVKIANGIIRIFVIKVMNEFQQSYHIMIMQHVNSHVALNQSPEIDG